MATRKRKPAKRKGHRRTTTKRRRRRGLGDMTFGQRKASVKAARELCRQGYQEYCGRSFKERRAASRAAAEAEAGAWAKMSPSAVAASEAKAEKRGCTPKGKLVCVDERVAKVQDRYHFHKDGTPKFKLRHGCKSVPGVKGAYRCTPAAVKAAESVKTFGPVAPRHGKQRRFHAPDGYVVVGAKVAKKKAGGLKKGCKKSRGHFVCMKPAARLYASHVKRTKRSKKKK